MANLGLPDLRPFDSGSDSHLKSLTILPPVSLGRRLAGKEQDLNNAIKIASILERLRKAFSDATIDYRIENDTLDFTVRVGGMRHVVNFSDDLLEKKTEKELFTVILGIVQRATTQSLPVHFMVRNDDFQEVLRTLKR